MPTWSETYEAALVIEPRFSAWRATGILITHGGALLLAASAIPWPAARLLTVAAAGVSLWVCCRRLYGDTRVGRLARLVWSRNNGWVGYRVGHPPVALERLSGCFVSPWVVQLRFSSSTGPLEATLIRDALPPEVFRRLRARLRALALQGA